MMQYSNRIQSIKRTVQKKLIRCVSSKFKTIVLQPPTNERKLQNVKEWTEKLNRHFIKEDIQMANKQPKITGHVENAN